MSDPGRLVEILVIEDDSDIREVLGLLLSSEGYSVAGAENGKLGLELAQTLEGLRLIFLDLMMPVMSGWDFLRARARDESLNSIPMIVLSASNIDEMEAKNAGADQLLKKPLNLAELIEIAQRLLPSDRPK